uniref:Uncharacterized protein n=1 Tax=Candidatus Kentrum sp. TUN TaxID=2126343 RepID=A0A450ZK22_9GAMM|nr:MAG: hypothetical protein BECKTUN1418F_GA0071002_103714 [Candidatus Kentron sp. TUN]VFK56119.1 MAG: hypothetical protein BECKTUN1418E_GA0071001_103714 [Candidatus Kentron sp. TUN]VFK56833.1 MAG: hypothetical protein BECKTUN1418D_GA0071000_105314 [Candidatus Kentron sp. TUN]
MDLGKPKGRGISASRQDEHISALRHKTDRGWGPGTRTDSPKFLFFRYLKKGGEFRRTRIARDFRFCDTRPDIAEIKITCESTDAKRRPHGSRSSEAMPQTNDAA